MLTGNQQPDHSRISDFRRRHLDALAGLLVQVLRLCQKAGLVSLGHVALDGTKLKANASKHKAMSHERMLKSERQLEGEMRALLRKAEIIDAQEDGQYAKGKWGDELPQELQRRSSRLEWIRKAKAELEAEAAAAKAAQRQEQATAKTGPAATRKLVHPVERGNKDTPGLAGAASLEPMALETAVQTPQDVEAMQRLAAAGWGRRRIARELGCSPETVRKYLRQGGWQPYGRPSRDSLLDGQRDWLRQRCPPWSRRWQQQRCDRGRFAAPNWPAPFPSTPS